MLEMIYEIYFIALLLSGFISLNLGFYIWWKYWSKKHVQQAKTLGLMMLATAVWAFGVALALRSVNSSYTYFWEQFKYIGILLLPPSWLVLALQWTGRDEHLTTRKISLIYLPSLLSLLLVFTDSFHHLIYSKIEYISVPPYILDSVVHGAGWWFLTIYSYLLLLLGTVLLVDSLVHLGNIYRKQIVILLTGCFAPWVANIINSLNLNSLPLVDFSPTAFIITGLTFAWGLSRFKLIDILPVARDAIFENMKDPVFVLDAQNRIVDLTPVTEKIFNCKIPEVIGKQAEDIFSDQYDLINHLKDDKESRCEISINKMEEMHYFDTQIDPLHDWHNQFTGYVIALRDITKRKQVENVLRDSEEKFRTFTESSPVAIMIYQGDRWIYANPAAEQITGYAKDEFLSMNFWDFIHPDYMDLIVKIGETGQRDNLTKEKYEFKIVTKKGAEKWVYSKADSIKYEEKTAVLISAVDITDRKLAENVSKKLSTAINASIDGMAILRKNEGYIYLNDAYAKIHGYDNPEELTGKTWRDFFNEREFEKIDKEIMPKLLAEGRWRGETIGRKRDGSMFNQEISLTALEDNEIICVARDTTKQNMILNELKDAHEALYTINKNLGRKVKERTAEIERLIKQKDEFVNQLGHDLKTPLTPMIVLVPLLKKKIKTSEDKELLEVVERNIHYMKDLVNKTIDLAKLNSDKIRFNIEDTNLLSEVDNVIKNSKIIVDDDQIKIENKVDKKLIVKADKLRLNELLNNLITNSIKYTIGQKEEITVDAKEDNDFVIVSVRDTGIGMDKEQLDHIFEEFYKTDDSRHNLDSSGLGLSICKRIVEKHGGRIWAESLGKGKGSTFYFTLRSGRK